MGAGHPAPRRRHRHGSLARCRPGDRLLPRRRLGVPPNPGTGCGGRRHDDAGIRGRLPRRGRHRERVGRRSPALRLLRVRRPARSPAHGRGERGQGRGHGPRRLALVLGRRHLPERLAPRGRAGPPGARPPRGAHPRGRRRRRGGDGDRGRPEPGCGEGRRRRARRGARCRRDGGCQPGITRHGVPRRDGHGPPTPVRGRPAALGPGRPVPLLMPGDPAGGRRGRGRGPHDLRDPDAGPRSPAGAADQR